MRDLKGYIQYAKERSRETKEKILSRLLRKEVEIGANGTQNYIIWPLFLPHVGCK